MKDLRVMVDLMKNEEYRSAKLILSRILKGSSVKSLYDTDLEDNIVEEFLCNEFNKYADKMNASFWQVQGSFPDWDQNRYEIKLLSIEESENLAIISNKDTSYGIKDVMDVPLFDWDLGKYPKLEMLNKQAEAGDLTDEEELAYSEAARKFYGSGEWVENIPQDEMWLGSNNW